ncbi:MAG TPA: aminoacyl-tRNA hydrolase [Candidatus Saccharimonadales bacterium]|nr:aminoacyl-tRNA hydrolase [Candidatus Saccharimonadales bacterium]
MQKRPNFGINDTRQLYTIGLHKKYIIVGLGNIGEEYDITRHNVGFMCVDDFQKINDFPKWLTKKDLKSLQSSQTISDNQVVLIKPTTLMNNSGEAIRLVMSYYNIPAENILVIHDELDIKFGEVRIRGDGSSAGHNGIKSIIESLGEESFTRIRVGIGPKSPATIDSRDFVLKNFNKDEQKELPKLYKEVGAIISEYVNGIKLEHETRKFL